MGGAIKRLAIDEGFLHDEEVFGAWHPSLIMWFMHLEVGKELETLFVVRGEGSRIERKDVVGGIESSTGVLRHAYKLWGHADEVRLLDEWVMPEVRVVSLRELTEFCGE